MNHTRNRACPLQGEARSSLAAIVSASARLPLQMTSIVLGTLGHASSAEAIDSASVSGVSRAEIIALRSDAYSCSRLPG